MSSGIPSRLRPNSVGSRATPSPAPPAPSAPDISISQSGRPQRHGKVNASHSPIYITKIHYIATKLPHPDAWTPPPRQKKALNSSDSAKVFQPSQPSQPKPKPRFKGSQTGSLTSSLQQPLFEEADDGFTTEQQVASSTNYSVQYDGPLDNLLDGPPLSQQGKYSSLCIYI